MTKEGRWQRVSRKRLCPICKKPDWCTISPDGEAVCCMRAKSAKRAKNGGWIHRLTDPVPRYEPPPKEKEPASRTPEQWEEIVDSHYDMGKSLRKRLSEELGITVQSLQALAVGYGFDGKEYSSWPSRSPDGNFCGVIKRYVTGKKRCIPGSSIQLFYRKMWSLGQGPIFLPEGGTDVASLISMGLCAVGRPTNIGGVQHLAKLLTVVDKNRAIVVLGENDKRLCKAPHRCDGCKDECRCHGCLRCWPGREGAILTARDLASHLGRRIWWCLTPGGQKDVREWNRIVGDKFLSECRRAIQNASGHRAGKADPQGFGTR